MKSLIRVAPSKGKIYPHPDPHFPKPIAPKINARAFGTIEGKIYVMSFLPLYHLRKLPSPVFECYDINKMVWEELPPPPHCFDYDGQFTYGFHFVVGPKIYLRTWRGFYRYDVPCAECEFIPEIEWQWELPIPFDCGSDEEWDEWDMEDNIKNKDLDNLVPISPAHPYHSICLAEPGKGGLAVGYTAQGLAGYWFSDNGELLDQDVLHELNEKLPRKYEYGGGKVCSAGKNKFCLILSGKIDKPSGSLGVATFDLKYNIVGDGGSFYHDHLCYHQFDNVSPKHCNANHYEDYQLNDVNFRLYDNLEFLDAFVISSESKFGFQ